MEPRRLRKPAGGVLAPPRRLERICVRVPETDGAGAGPGRIQPATLEHGKSRVKLPEVASRAGNHDEQFGVSLWIEPMHVPITEQLDGLLRPAERSLAVCAERQRVGA